jgi:hypothetical protein
VERKMKSTEGLQQPGNGVEAFLDLLRLLRSFTFQVCVVVVEKYRTLGRSRDFIHRVREA